MAPTIHLVRHAEAMHNVSLDHVVLPDARLTARGRAQADALATTFPFMAQVTHLVSSPLDRAIETCVRGLGPAMGRGGRVPRIVLHPDLQETGAYACNVPSKLGWLVLRWGRHVDAALLAPGWDERGPGSVRDEGDPAKVRAREVRARRWLRDLARAAADDAHIVVVSHQNFIGALAGDRGRQSALRNAAFRSYQFQGDDHPVFGPTLVETFESRT